MVRGSFALVMIIALLAIVASEQARRASPGKPYFPTTFDDVNVDVYLKNDRLRDETYHCVYGDGPCRSDFATYYKKYAPQMLRTNCARCTSRQKEAFVRTRKWYVENRPQQYRAYLTKIANEAHKHQTQKPHTHKS